MITIPLNTDSGVRILPKATEPEPKRKQTEDIPSIGISITQAAKLIGVSKMTFLPLIKEGIIRTVKIRKRVIVSVQSLREFVDGKIEPCNSIENNVESQDENPQKH